jgi:hypothetical protein
VSYPGPPLRGPSIVELPLLFYRFVIQVVETYLSTSSHTPYPSFDTVVGQACLGRSRSSAFGKFPGNAFPPDGIPGVKVGNGAKVKER